MTTLSAILWVLFSWLAWICGISFIAIISILLFSRFIHPLKIVNTEDEEAGYGRPDDDAKF